ncbi:tripartite tricarboxylate transporter substrate binding protein [Variovorax sp. J22R133]|uniref:Bug family tripartite tricarboxylate transporter substrate binding protein n=1 Tax=Variovorax brevis TaxID=3053503 RepID=UPI002576A645|nr:tripartite tricarboxylate transporter substrate binding protein [Variovorax sp. J22R133]MDM0116037.1 tripartite tricarboxylate transporter substrate binding protein [Variovorax sp. J22R133]
MAPAWAESFYPSKPVVIIVPQAPGGTNDAVGRIIAQKLTEQMGQSFVVDNRAGAGGNIGTQVAGAAAKDGYTLLLTISSTQAINPWLYKKVPFDPVKDFEPIASVGVVPNVLVVNPAFPAKSMSEFVKVVRDHNPPYQYASAGNGSLNHLLGEMLNQKAGLQLAHIPYKGIAPALNDVLGGQVPMAFASLPSCIQHIRAGRLRALGVSSSKRSPSLPDVPAIAEVVPGFSGELWVGFFAPAGVSKPIIQRLVTEIEKASGAPDVLEKFKGLGVQRLPGGPDVLAMMLKEDLATWGPIVKTSGANVD